MALEQSLVLIKPDGLKHAVAGQVVDRMLAAGLRLVAAKVTRVPEPMAVEHYKHLKDMPFFKELIDFITGKIHGEEFAGILALVVQGEGAVAKIRELAGATHPEKADPVSIRGAFGRITSDGRMENVMHASSDPAEAEREIKLWFRPDEILKPLWKTKASSNEHKAKAWA